VNCVRGAKWCCVTQKKRWEMYVLEGVSEKKKGEKIVIIPKLITYVCNKEPQGFVSTMTQKMVLEEKDNCGGSRNTDLLFNYGGGAMRTPVH